MQKCRFCHKDAFTRDVIKYSLRHYAHPECGLQAKGVEFFNRLSKWQLRQFPNFIAGEFGLEKELARRIRAK